jgi:hypothetical protein
MAKDDTYEPITDPETDPRLNDDAQPSVTSAAQVLEQANKRAGVPESKAEPLPPADAVDLEVRKLRAGADTMKVAEAVHKIEEEGARVPGLGVDDVAAAVAEGASPAKVAKAAKDAEKEAATGPDDLAAKVKK